MKIALFQIAIFFLMYENCGNMDHLYDRRLAGIQYVHVPKFVESHVSRVGLKHPHYIAFYTGWVCFSSTGEMRAMSSLTWAHYCWVAAHAPCMTAAIVLHSRNASPFFIVEEFSVFLQQSNKHPAPHQEFEAVAKTDDSPVITALLEA